ncbi:MAG: hypothetical protein HY329_06965 [Chloroflexi bacterium]|nr:hypothetical protein [Chloroflexota bacterium]
MLDELVTAERLRLPGSLDSVNQHFYEQGWTDGLPIVPPTEERVARMLAFTDRAPDDVVGEVAPAWAPATVEAIAINAVMAGCEPSYLPVVITAVEAITDPAFNLYSLQSTTNPVAPALVIGGPIAAEIGVNSKGNCFGQGARANATIGRAIRLIMLNVGGGLSPDMDKATHGQPGKYSFCTGENEDDSPWPPLRTDFGFSPEVTTVTAMGIVHVTSILNYGSKTAEGLLHTFARSAAFPGIQNIQLGGGPVFCFAPEHAQIMASQGFSKEDVRRYLYEHARVPRSDFDPDVLSIVIQRRRPRWTRTISPQSAIPIADDCSLIGIFVAGGPGLHSLIMPTYGEDTHLTCKAVVRRDGTPAKSIREFARE